MILEILGTFLGGFKFFPFYYSSSNRRFDKKRSMWQSYVFDEKLKCCIWKDDFVRNKPKG